MENYIEHITKQSNIITSILEQSYHLLVTKLQVNPELHHQCQLLAALANFYSKIIDQFQKKLDYAAKDQAKMLAYLIKLKYKLATMKQNLLRELNKLDFSALVLKQFSQLCYSQIAIAVLCCFEFLKNLNIDMDRDLFDKVASRCIEKMSQQAYVRNLVYKIKQGKLLVPKCLPYLQKQGFKKYEIDEMLQKLEIIQSDKNKKVLLEPIKFTTIQDLAYHVEQNSALKKDLERFIQKDYQEILEIENILQSDMKLVTEFYRFYYFGNDDFLAINMKLTVAFNEQTLVLPEGIDQFSNRDICQFLIDYSSQFKQIKLSLFAKDDYKYQTLLREEKFKADRIVCGTNPQECQFLIDSKRKGADEVQFVIAKSKGCFSYQCLGVRSPSFYRLKSQQSTILNEGEVINLGGKVYIMIEQCIHRTQEQAKGQLPQIQLKVVQGNPHKTQKLGDNGQPITIGSNKELAQFYLSKSQYKGKNFTVSREHCEVLQDQNGYWNIRDKGSKYGTFLSCQTNEMYNQRMLKHADISSLGSQISQETIGRQITCEQQMEFLFDDFRLLTEIII